MESLPTADGLMPVYVCSPAGAGPHPAVIVVMEHTAKDGSPRLVRECTFPLTGKAVVHRVITDLAVLEVEAGAFRVVELAPDVERETVQQHTGAPLRW